MAKYSSEQSVLDVIATASVLKAENQRLETALRMYIGRSEGLLARNEVLEQESAESRKKLQEAEDRAIRAEVAAAMYKLEALEATTALRITQGLYAEET